LGSVRNVTDSSGAVKDTIVYDGYGNITSETDSTKRGNIAWTGRDYDPQTGLYYGRDRYYDPKTGRWQSQDRWGFAAFDPNLYRYVGNNTPNATDPSGFASAEKQRYVTTRQQGIRAMFDSGRQFMGGDAASQEAQFNDYYGEWYEGISADDFDK